MPKVTIEITEQEFLLLENQVKREAVACLAGIGIPDMLSALAYEFCKAVRIQRGEWNYNRVEQLARAVSGMRRKNADHQVTLELTEEQLAKLEYEVKRAARRCFVGGSSATEMTSLAHAVCKAARIQRGEWDYAQSARIAQILEQKRDG